jgi:zinc finger-like protein
MQGEAWGLSCHDGAELTSRGLICKVEEIHRTLKKHLAKEEGQLLPLLLQHFTFSEQAKLVAQFLYCIPLATVERVLAWLKPLVPKVS